MMTTAMETWQGAEGTYQCPRFSPQPKQSCLGLSTEPTHSMRIFFKVCVFLLIITEIFILPAVKVKLLVGTPQVSPTLRIMVLERVHWPICRT